MARERDKFIETARRLPETETSEREGLALWIEAICTQNDALTAALDQYVREINNLLLEIALNAPDRFTKDDTAIVFARAALEQAKKAKP